MIPAFLPTVFSLAPIPGLLAVGVPSHAGTAAVSEPSASREVSDGLVEEASSAPDEKEPDDESNAVRRLTAWKAPPTCVQLEELRQEVERHLSADPEVARQVRGEMLRGPAGWIVTLTVYESERRLGERLLQLDGDACRVHDETLALVVALLLEHGPPSPSEPPTTEETTPDEVEEKPPSEPGVEGEEEPMVPKQAPPTVEPRQPLPLRAGVGARLVTGWLPSVGWGTSVFVGARLFEFGALDLLGDFYLPKTTVFESVTVRASGGRVHGRGCALPSWGAFGLSPCAGLGWIGFSAAGREVTEPKTVFLGAFEGSVSLSGSYQVAERWAFEGGVEGIFPLRRGNFVLESATGEVPVYRTSAVIFSAHVGVVLTL